MALVQPPIDPSQYPDYLQLQRKQQLAQQLMGAFQQSNETPQNWDSMRVVPKRGALQNVASLATALMAGKANKDAFSAERGFAQGQANQFNAMFPGSQPPGQSAQPPVDPKVAQLTAAISTANQAAPGIALPMDSAPQPQQAQPAQAAAPQPQTPQSGSQIPSLTGDPQRDRMMAVQMGVPKYLEAVAKRYDWTDQQKNDIYRGITANQSRTMAMADSLKGAVVPGSSSTLGLDASGNVQSAPVGGLGANMAQMTAANTAATQTQMPHEVKDSQGRPVFQYTTPPALRQQGIIPTATDNGGGQTTAGAAFQADQGKAGAAFGTQINADAENALQGKRTLSEMGNLLQGFTPGAGAPVLQALGSAAQAMGVPEDKVTAFTGMNVGDTQAFQKGTANLAAEAAKQMTNKVTQQEFKVYLANNPNWMMTSTGIKKAMDFMGKGFDQTLDKQQAWQQFTSNPKNDPGRYSIDFPASYDAQTRAKIASGGLNSSPTAQIPVRTATDMAAAGAKPPPPIGTVMQGHKFLGGNPADPQSWQQVQ